MIIQIRRIIEAFQIEYIFQGTVRSARTNSPILYKRWVSLILPFSSRVEVFKMHQFRQSSLLEQDKQAI